MGGKYPKRYVDVVCTSPLFLPAALAICQTRLKEFNVTHRVVLIHARGLADNFEPHATSAHNIWPYVRRDTALNQRPPSVLYGGGGGTKSEECLGYFWVGAEWPPLLNYESSKRVARTSWEIRTQSHV